MLISYCYGKRKKGTASKCLHAGLAPSKACLLGDPWGPLGKGSRSADPTEALAPPMPRAPSHPGSPSAAQSQERTCLPARARAHTHTHTHTHTLQARVPACRLSSSGLCIPYLHDLTIRQNNTQGAHLLVSPRSTPHPQPAPLPPAPSPGAGNLLFKAGEQTGREQLASPESSLALQTPGDGGGRGAWRPDCVRCRLAMDKSTQAPSDCNPRGLQAPR